MMTARRIRVQDGLSVGRRRVWRASGRAASLLPECASSLPSCCSSSPARSRSCSLRGEGEDPAALAIDRYAAAWTRGDDAAPRRSRTTRRRPRAALKANRAGLDGASVPRACSAADERRRRARARSTWKVPGFGTYSYAVRLTAVEGASDEWRVRWRETRRAPRARARDTRLGTSLDRPRRGEILDRGGRALVTERSVVDVGVEVDKAREPDRRADRRARRRRRRRARSSASRTRRRAASCP